MYGSKRNQEHIVKNHGMFGEMTEGSIFYMNNFGNQCNKLVDKLSTNLTSVSAELIGCIQAIIDDNVDLIGDNDGDSEMIVNIRDVLIRSVTFPTVRGQSEIKYASFCSVESLLRLIALEGGIGE